MPFTSVTELPANPAVRIFFSGLLILDPNPNPDPSPGVNTCEVFVHRSAPDHHLTVEVRRKRAGKPDIIMMRHVGQLAFTPPPTGTTPRFGMSIRVNIDPKGVRKYDPPEPNDNPSPEGESFDLAIDLEGPQYHDGSVGEVSPLGGRPSILLNDAVFYTAAKSPQQNIVLKQNSAVVVPQLPPFASVIGANIYLDDDGDPDTRVLVSWVQQGLVQILELEKSQEEGVSYEIYVVNEPLYEADDSRLPAHDEFREYYKILPGVPRDEQFELEVPKPPPGTPQPLRGSTTTPCMPVVLGGGS